MFRLLFLINRATILAMSSQNRTQRIFVAGATGFVGNAVVYALLEAGASVTALIPPGRTLQINSRHERLRLVEGDVWNRGSLTGRSRGHNAIIHLVGSLKQNASRGQTYHHINVDSLQNITRMAINDGVPLLVYLSTSSAPWLPANYVRSKRESEQYLQRSGVRYTMIRAPLAYPRGKLFNPLLIMVSIAGGVPLLGRPFSRWAPQPVDILAKGIAESAISGAFPNQIIYGRKVRQLSRAYLQRLMPPPPGAASGQDAPEEFEAPFGWLP